MIFLLIASPVPQTPKPLRCLQFYHSITLLILQIGTLSQYITDQLLLQPDQQPYLQNIFIEMQNHQQPSYMSHHLNVYHPWKICLYLPSDLLIYNKRMKIIERQGFWNEQIKQ